jgi:hypothetical protein
MMHSTMVQQSGVLLNSMKGVMAKVARSILTRSYTTLGPTFGSYQGENLFYYAANGADEGTMAEFIMYCLGLLGCRTEILTSLGSSPNIRQLATQSHIQRSSIEYHYHQNSRYQILGELVFREDCSTLHATPT